MKELIICNTIPVYQEAPVSSELYRKDNKKIIEELMGLDAKRHVLITQDRLEEIPQGLEVICPEKKNGFVFGNYSALLKVLIKEKPIPSQSNKDRLKDDILFLTAEDLLGLETKQVYVSEGEKKGSVHEVSKAVTPNEILNTVKSKNKVKGMYFGYPMGLFVNENAFDEKVDLITDYIEIYSEEDCMLDRLLKVASIFQRETCGRCVFGHEGVTQIMMILSDMVMKKGKSSDIELLLDLAGEMKNQTLCEIGEALADSVITALSCFKEEIEGHITRKSCQAGVCAKFVTYHILPDLCIGCTDCADECEDDAILGKKKFIHVIDQDECTQCGKCLSACDEGAIVKAGAIKPKGPKKPMPCR